MRPLLLTFVASLIFPVTQAMASATDVYLAQSAAGSGDGSSCANAGVYTFFNTGANWGSGSAQIGPGTTVHLCGTFSFGAAQDTVLTFQGSGSSGSPVTLLFESGASLQAQSWSAPAIYSTGNSYITINGGTNGLIEATLNGYSSATCPAGACTLTTDFGSCLLINNGSNVTVTNLNCGPLYVHYCPSGLEANCPDEGGSDTFGIALSMDDNVLLTGNTCQGSWGCISIAWGTNSNWTISNNTIFYSNIGILGSGGSGAGTLTGLIVSGNVIHDGYNWSDQGNLNHHDGMHLFSVVSGSVISGLQVYDNYIYGNWGDGINAFIFIECNSGGTCPSPQVFNNLLVDATVVPRNGNGFISVDGTSPVIANNTMVGTSITQYGAGVWTGTNAVIENNTEQNVSFALTNASGGTISVMDYNNYYNIGNWNNGTFAQWQTSCSCDAHSTGNTNPNLSASYQPTASSTALIRQGANLTSLSITALDSDKAGIARPASGAWDVGAYQSSGPVRRHPPIF